MRLNKSAQWQQVPADYVNEGGFQEPGPRGKPPRRWRWRHLVYAFLAFMMLIIAWLAITAPLSKSLQPIAAPSLTLLSAEGEPIARRGADIREPVKISELP